MACPWADIVGPVVGAIVAISGIIVGAHYARKSAGTSQDSADAAQVSADAAQENLQEAKRSSDAAETSASAAQVSADAAQANVVEARRSADAAEKSANIAAEALDIKKKEGLISLEVSIGRGEIDAGAGATWDALFVEIRNTGRSVYLATAGIILPDGNPLMMERELPVSLPKEQERFGELPGGANRTLPTRTYFFRKEVGRRRLSGDLALRGFFTLQEKPGERILSNDVLTINPAQLRED